MNTDYRTLTYEVTGAIARITFDRPEHGNAITSDTPVELASAVERADLDPAVHVILLSGRGKGFCGGYDLSIFAEGMARDAGDPSDQSDPSDASGEAGGSVLDPGVQARNHDPRVTWDPMVDYAMMSRFNRGFSSLLHANKPTVAKLHGFAVAGGTDIALFADLIICADDTRIGYPPARVWGIPASGMWAHRLGDQRAKRLLFTGDLITGRQAHDWGLASDAPPPEELDHRTEDLVGRIARMPVNQLVMAKLALNSALLAQGVANSGMISTVFDGIARHTPEGYAFQARAAADGFREAVRRRDEPFGDAKPHAGPGDSATTRP
ncbi:MAG: crotonase/enoyl-CoA hydratase family protein [Dietzia sp.]|uniref:crotonase/enoyl-CoA hydratase family protein n=1 Tax=Dietzia sp. TaxID=1871616 RepID=UPI00271784D5|nr:crotonase/enoyl-CoA hydratase family protein [Dietzia sp.]MDO8394971.1 crotonase/enoyl-CoA hydratase family protein [Dietzia sp.]